MEDGAGVDAAAEQQPEQQPTGMDGHHAAMEAAVAEAPAESPAEAPADPELEAFNSLWTQARESGDFHTWTSLISTAERLNDLDKLRQVYDAFLAEYPLCFGYWKKFAEAEAQHGQPVMATHVYERGVAAAPFSVDMWALYAAHRLNTGASQEEVEGLFERAIPYVGSDYHAHALWDKYLKYEHNISNTAEVAAIYTRVLGLPLRDLERYYNEFQAYAKERTAAEMAAPGEAAEIRAELERALRAALEAAAAKKRQQAAIAAAAEAQLPANGLAGGQEESAAAEGAVAMDAEAAQQEAEAAAPTGQAEVMAVDGAAGEAPAHDATQHAPGAAAVPGAASEDAVMAEAEGAHPQPPIANGTAPAGEPASGAAAAEQGAEGDCRAAQGEGAAGQEAGAASGAAALREAAAVLPIPIPDIADADIKRQWMALREAAYKAAKAEREQRQPFESALRRPYFHVKPVDPTQLAVWSKYLDWSEAHADSHDTVRLYERCLVPCANYPEFWMRYVRYLDSKGDKSRAREALHRATSLYCKRSPQIFLFAARRRELQQQQEAAVAGGGNAAAGAAAGGEGEEEEEDVRDTYTRVAQELAPGLVQCAVQRANFERRQGDAAAACHVLEEALAAAAAALQQQTQQNGEVHTSTAVLSAGGSNTLASYTFLAIQYAHFLHAVLGDAQRAQQVYAEALARAPHSRALWEGAVHLETVVRGEGYVGRVLQLYDRATAPPVAAAAPAAAKRPKQEPVQQQPDTVTQEPGGVDAAAAGAQQQQQQPGGAAGLADGDGQGEPTPAAAAGPAAPAAARGLSERDREELSERMVAFADLHGSTVDLRRAEALHHQRFRLPLALLGAGAAAAKRGAVEEENGGAHAGDARKAAAAAAGLTEEEAATAAAMAAASTPAAPMDYYGAYGYDASGYAYGAAGYGYGYYGYGY